MARGRTSRLTYPRHPKQGGPVGVVGPPRGTNVRDRRARGEVSMSDRQVPVLIVGGSLVGLSTSLLLAAQEAPHLLVEPPPGTAVHPRAAPFPQPAMEIFRSVG